MWNRVKGEHSKGEQSKGEQSKGEQRHRNTANVYRHQELRLVGVAGKGCVSKYRPSERQHQGYEKVTRVEYGVTSTPAKKPRYKGVCERGQLV